MAIFVCSFWLCDSVFAQAQSGVVISQIYGAGGNSGAIYRNDFIELFNRGSSTVDLNGWAVAYSSSTGSNWQKTELSGSIAPGKRMLIQQASGGANGAVLPAADITGSISLASTAGKVLLTSTATSIAAGTVCPSGPPWSILSVTERTPIVLRVQGRPRARQFECGLARWRRLC
ncbi:MAG: lamin tail domain-containing protein [Acidobacteria bacterium]|nr:lamin tail domain-containing protein [Acidobacteriota bacterium]